MNNTSYRTAEIIFEEIKGSLGNGVSSIKMSEIKKQKSSIYNHGHYHSEITVIKQKKKREHCGYLSLIINSICSKDLFFKINNNQIWKMYRCSGCEIIHKDMRYSIAVDKVDIEHIFHVKTNDSFVNPFVELECLCDVQLSSKTHPWAIFKNKNYKKNDVKRFYLFPGESQSLNNEKCVTVRPTLGNFIVPLKVNEFIEIATLDEERVEYEEDKDVQYVGYSSDKFGIRYKFQCIKELKEEYVFSIKSNNRDFRKLIIPPMIKNIPIILNPGLINKVRVAGLTEILLISENKNFHIKCGEYITPVYYKNAANGSEIKVKFEDSLNFLNIEKKKKKWHIEGIRSVQPKTQ